MHLVFLASRLKKHTECARATSLCEVTWEFNMQQTGATQEYRTLPAPTTDPHIPTLPSLALPQQLLT